MGRRLVAILMFAASACGDPVDPGAAATAEPATAEVRIDRFIHEVRWWCHVDDGLPTVIYGEWCLDGQAADYVEVFIANGTAQTVAVEVVADFFDRDSYRVDGYPLRHVTEASGGGLFVASADGVISVPPNTKWRATFMTFMWADFEAGTRKTLDEAVAEHPDAVSWGLRLRQQ